MNDLIELINSVTTNELIFICFSVITLAIGLFLGISAAKAFSFWKW